MFRVSQFMHAILNPESARPMRQARGPVVIWNLVRRCNLCCRHCYAISADKDFPGELSTDQIYATMDDLKSFGVPALILSGGEPLMHKDIYAIGKRAKQLGFYVGLSTNGTLINDSNRDAVAAVGFDYLGISIDGLQPTHDKFRQMDGAFTASMAAIRKCRDLGVKVGMRFTVTSDNAHELPALLDIADEEHIDKFYVSHLNYAGRGNRNRRDDVIHQMSRDTLDLLFERAYADAKAGGSKEFVTGNNDADGVYLLYWVRKHAPHAAEFIHERLRAWGGNSSGVNVANIDNLGNVHPDTMWWDYTLGNVKERPFSEIWNDTSDPLMAGLKAKPRPLEGRCGECMHKDICSGNTRVRAWQISGNAWAEDPACYMSDEEIGVSGDRDRLAIAASSRQQAHS